MENECFGSSLNQMQIAVHHSFSLSFVRSFIRSFSRSFIRSFIRSFVYVQFHIVYRFLFFSRFSECEYKLMFTQNLSSLNSTEKSLFFSLSISGIEVVTFATVFFCTTFYFFKHKMPIEAIDGCNYAVKSCYIVTIL